MERKTSEKTYHELYRIHFNPRNEKEGWGFTVDVSPEFLRASKELGEKVDLEKLNKFFASAIKTMGFENRIGGKSGLVRLGELGYSGTQLKFDDTSLNLVDGASLEEGGQYNTHNVDTPRDFAILFYVFNWWATSVSDLVYEQQNKPQSHARS